MGETYRVNAPSESVRPIAGTQYAVWMGQALEVAAGALAAGDVPVGAVVFSPDGEVLGLAHNQREADGDPTAHAEVITLEPCLMCAGALMLARIGRLVLGAWDPKAGACGSVWDVVRDRRATHRVEVIGGIREQECSEILLDFFAGHRL